MTALGPIDQRSLDALWRRAVAAGAVSEGVSQPTSAEAFGDSLELADELIALVIDGPKRATAGAVADYEHAGEPLPEVGHMWFATDGHGRARALLRTTDVRVGPLSSVDDQFARDEGEGDRTRRYWLAEHERVFRRQLRTLGIEFDDDMPTVFERFEILHAE